VQILNVAQTYFPYLAEGGRPVKVRTLSRQLARRGHKVTVLTAYLGQKDWLSGVPAPDKCAIGWRAIENEVEAVYLPTWARYRTLTINPGLMGFCRNNLGRFDLVHFYGLYDLMGPTVSYFCRRQGIPYVIEPMGMYRPIDRNLRLKRLWHRVLGDRFLQNAAQIIATSEMERDELLHEGVSPEKLAVRYNGIDEDASASPPSRGSFRAKWRISSNEPLILFLGRLIPRKGADVLIDAFSQACPEFGRLVIAGPEGEAGYLAYLKRHAVESGAATRVLFTGPLYGEEKKAVLADADLFVLPSRYENFANSAAEAIGCGLPVIVTESCGICSLIDGRAGLVIGPEQNALAAALYRLLSDRPLYTRFKVGCPGVAGQLSWEHLTEQMEGYYMDILARRNGIN